MSKDYNFSRDPFDENRERSQQPPQNPFADDARDPPPPRFDPAGRNPYSAPTQYQPADQQYGYQMALPHRGPVILTLGILGLLGSLASFLCCLPIGVVNLALTLPAWLMGRSDLKAIDAGAMDSSGRGTVMAGFVLGIIGTVLTLLVLIVIIGFWTYSIISSSGNF
jgi:hypothetical protein